MTNMYAVYDMKAAAFLQPFFSMMDATAVRALSAAVNDPTTMLHKFPGDYALFQIGTFDEALGQLVGLNPPRQLCMAAALVEVSNVKGNGDASQP